MTGVADGPSDQVTVSGALRPASRMSGLDGLRALAVTAVFLFHADVAWVRGGYLGVDLFFVISGFLITSLLAGEIDATGRVELKQFYWRRAKRLLPASWLMTAAAIVAAAAFAADALPRLRADALASLVYVTNWELLSANINYFEAMGRQPLLQHLWSLAIEEQFYIIWAPVMAFVLPRVGRGVLAAAALIAAVAMVLWMADLAAQMGYPGHGYPTRLLFGTDTHGFPLLLGAVIGLLWRPERYSAAVPAAVSDGIFTLGLAALVGLLCLFSRLGEETEWLYPWGFLVAAGISGLLIVTGTYQGSTFGRWLDQAPLRWLGERSYGIYLWHWPIFQLTRPNLDWNLNSFQSLTLRIVLTLVIAALSYSFIEMPIRRGLLGHIWRGLRTPGRRIIAAGNAAILVGLCVAGLALVLMSLKPSTHWNLASLFQPASASAQAAPSPALKPVIKAQPETYAGSEVTAVGDSVLLGSSAVFMKDLPGAKIYAHVGWQAADAITELQTLGAAHSLTPVIVIHLGTNGYIYERQLRQILTLLGDRKRVVLVNTHVPRRWMDPNNDLFDRLAPEYPNVVLVDWRKVSEGQNNYFVADGVHLTVRGQRAFVGEIMRAGHLSAAPVPQTTPPGTSKP